MCCHARAGLSIFTDPKTQFIRETGEWILLQQRADELVNK